MEAVDEEVIAQIFYLSAVVGIHVVIVFSSPAKINVAMAAHRGSGASRDIQHTSEAAAIFRSESARHQIYSLKYLWTNARTQLRLGVVEKRNAIDKFMQGELRPANCQEIVMAVACAGHQVRDQTISGFDQRIWEPF